MQYLSGEYDLLSLPVMYRLERKVPTGYKDYHRTCRTMVGTPPAHCTLHLLYEDMRGLSTLTCHMTYPLFLPWYLVAMLLRFYTCRHVRSWTV